MNPEQTGEWSNGDAKPCKGRILFIGAAYYNTWYLSREFRSLGWHADMFVYGGEGSDAYLHGTDYSLKVMKGPFVPNVRSFQEQGGRESKASAILPG